MTGVWLPVVDGGDCRRLVESITTASVDGLTVLAVDPLTHETQGVAEGKKGSYLKIHQGDGNGMVEATVDEKIEAPRWECGVGKEESLFHANCRDLREEKEQYHGNGGLKRDHEVSSCVVL